MSEINVTPFVDVMLVLLIIFMVTAPLLTVGVQVDLPESSADSLPEEQEPLTLTINSKGEIFVAGGDLNELPPGATKNNYCEEDRCPDELPEDDEGCDFSNETTWINPLYDTYVPSVSQADYQQNEQLYFTHASKHDINDERYQWNRKLDYLFTNTAWVPRSEITHQEAQLESDHVAVSAKWVVP